MNFKKLPPLEDIEKEEQTKEPEDINTQTDDIFKELFEPENLLDVGRQEVDKQHVETFIQGLDNLMRDDNEIQLY